MKLTLKNIGIGIAVLGGVFFLAYFGLGMKRYFAPKHAEVNREIFENTQSFVHGKAQYLSRLRMQYEDEDVSPAKKKSLRILIKSEASQIEAALLPKDLQRFLLSL